MKGKDILDFSGITLSSEKFDAKTIVMEFNDEKTSELDKIYLKSIINSAIAIFGYQYSGTYPPQTMVEEIVELAKANDRELYFSAVTALANVFPEETAITNLDAFQGLTNIIRYPGAKFKLEEDEIQKLLVLVLGRVRKDVPTLSALNDLLSAMRDADHKVASYPIKAEIKKQLKEIKKDSKNGAKFQADLALKTLEKIGIDEPPAKEWERRARALAAGIKSIIKIATDIAEMVATFGVSSVYAIPDIIKQAKKAAKNIAIALKGIVPLKEWYDKARDVQSLLAAAAIDKVFDGKNALKPLMMSDLKDVFDGIEKTVTLKDKAVMLAKKKIPLSIKYTFVDQLGKIALLRSDETIVDKAFKLLVDYYDYSFRMSKGAHGEYQALGVKVVEAFVSVEKYEASEASKKAHKFYLKEIQDINMEYYKKCAKDAEENLQAELNRENLETISNFVKLGQDRTNKLLENNSDLSANEVVIPLFGEDVEIRSATNVNQEFKATEYHGSPDDVLKMIKNAFFRNLLEKEQDAARSVISKQLVGKGGKVLASLNINQVGIAPVVDLTGGSKPLADQTKALKLSDSFRTILDTLLNDEKSYRFALRRSDDGKTINIKYLSSKDKPLAIGGKLGKLQNELESNLKDGVERKIESNDDGDELIISANDRKSMDPVADLLGQASGNILARKTYPDFFGIKEDAKNFDINPKENQHGCVFQ